MAPGNVLRTVLFSLQPIFPELSWASSSPRICRDPCPGSRPPPAPLPPPSSQVRSSQTSRISETERTHPASHWRVRASWGRDGITSFSLAKACARDLTHPGRRWHPPERINTPFQLRAAAWGRGLGLSGPPSSFLLVVAVGSPRSSKQRFGSTSKSLNSREELIQPCVLRPLVQTGALLGRNCSRFRWSLLSLEDTGWLHPRQFLPFLFLVKKAGEANQNESHRISKHTGEVLFFLLALFPAQVAKSNEESSWNGFFPAAE